MGDRGEDMQQMTEGTISTQVAAFRNEPIMVRALPSEPPGLPSVGVFLTTHSFYFTKILSNVSRFDVLCAHIPQTL